MVAKIREKDLVAKAAAVERFLGSGRQFEGLTALAASTKPEHNVVGIGIGPKLEDGKLTTRSCIRFYVEQKVAEASMPKASVIPRLIRGVPTDVIETGRFYALAKPIARTRLRPAQGGCSVGFRFTGSRAAYVMAGSFGTLVEDAAGKRSHWEARSSSPDCSIRVIRRPTGSRSSRSS